MIRSFVRRPTTTLMLVLFLVILGIASIRGMAIEDSPPIDFPLVSVQVLYPGASPYDVENDLVKPIEDAVSEISELKNIKSTSYENMAFIMIEFNIGVDTNVKVLEVKDKVERIQNDFPASTEKPIVSKLDIMASSVVDIVLAGDNYSSLELYNYANDILRPQLNAIKGIASVEIFGGEERQFNVRLDTDAMKSYYITIADVINGLSMYNIDMAAGDIKNSNVAVSVRFAGNIKNEEDLKNMKLATVEGQIFRLADIATVEDSIKDIETDAYLNDNRSLYLSLKKVTDGNAVEIAGGLAKIMPKLQAALPQGMAMSIANDSTVYTIENTLNTFRDILFGMFLTVIVLLVFTSNVRITFVTIVIVPAALIANFFTMSQSHFTINMMTLLAIASVLGTLIANALIIIEGALVRFNRGESPEDAAVNGTTDVVAAVFAATGTNLAVFIPLSMISGVMGLFMRQFGLTIVYATVLSIIMSFSLTPMMIAQMLTEKGKREENKIASFCIRQYKKFFDLVVVYKKTALAINVALIVLMFSMSHFVGSEFDTKSDTDEIAIDMKTDEGSTIEKTIAKSKEVISIVQKYPEVKSVVTKIGGNGVINSSLILKLVPLKSGRVSDLVLISRAEKDLAGIDEVELTVSQADSHGEPDITVNVYGQDYNTINKYSAMVMDKMRATGTFRAITSTSRPPKRERRFIPNHTKMDFYGITNAQVAQALRAALYGDTSNQIKIEGKSYDVNITLTNEQKDSNKLFDNVLVASYKGLIPISALGEVTELDSTSELTRYNRERIVEIEGYIGKGVLSDAEKLLTDELKSIEFEDGYGYRFGGASEMADESMASMAVAFLLAIIFTYMLLAAIMNSLLHPFTISLAIIPAFAGVFVGLLVTGGTMNIGSMISIIMLVGLSVNNEILVVEQAITLMRNKGNSADEALWFGYKDKLVTILMTSIAIIVATLPQMFSTNATISSMGTVLVSGLFFSLIFTFTLTPMVFIYMERFNEWFKGVKIIGKLKTELHIIAPYMRLTRVRLKKFARKI
ncbi:efflux RND transporter permease subunit [Deferribacterales bacterium RsTz2092]|nr:multidrug ABC transporter [Deferribacterales bacterium]